MYVYIHVVQVEYTVQYVCVYVWDGLLYII